jgi:hypothetical protein
MFTKRNVSQVGNGDLPSAPTSKNAILSFCRALRRSNRISSQLGLPASRLRIAHKSNMWIECHNHHASIKWAAKQAKFRPAMKAGITNPVAQI